MFYGLAAVIQRLNGFPGTATTLNTSRIGGGPINSVSITLFDPSIRALLFELFRVLSIVKQVHFNSPISTVAVCTNNNCPIDHILILPDLFTSNAIALIRRTLSRHILSHCKSSGLEAAADAERTLSKMSSSLYASLHYTAWLAFIVYY